MLPAKIRILSSIFRLILYMLFDLRILEKHLVMPITMTTMMTTVVTRKNSMVVAAAVVVSVIFYASTILLL